MPHKNVTLTIPEETLRMAKHLAVEKGVSLSRFLSEHLEELVQRGERYRELRTLALGRMKRGVPMGTGNRPRWKREELHER